MKKVKHVYQDLSALVWKEDKLFVAKAIEIEIASQGKTKNEALINLKEAIELYFKDEPKLNFNSPYKNISLENVRINYA